MPIPAIACLVFIVGALLYILWDAMIKNPDTSSEATPDARNEAPGHIDASLLQVAIMNQLADPDGPGWFLPPVESPKEVRAPAPHDPVEREIVRMISKITGLPERECTPNKSLIYDLDFEVDEGLGFEESEFEKLAARIMGAWAVDFPVHHLQVVLARLEDGGGTIEIQEALDVLRRIFHLDFDNAVLPGFKPYNRRELNKSVVKLITVGMLVNFVKHEIRETTPAV